MSLQDDRLAVVIMAAGKGTRMNNPSMAKVMYEINGRPLVEWVVDLARRLRASRTVVVVGWRKESVVAHLARVSPSAVCVTQDPQLGTGHAVMQAEPVLQGFTGDVLVLSGDVPLLTEQTTRELIASHREKRVAATVLTAIPEDATGYGRVLRDREGNVTAIVEHKDATEEQRKVREINSGIYAFRAANLFEGLHQITPNNAQKEYYLTDVFEVFWRRKMSVAAVTARDPVEIGGINTPEQLEEARRLLAGRES
jgi:UDP-N-acetylglucosamine pyrophosphorylase